MKKILTILFSFLCISLSAHTLYPEHCDWTPAKNLRIYHIRWDGEECPKIWERYRGAYCIYGVNNGWKIRRRNYYITPEYVIVKDFDDDKTPAAFAALQRFFYISPLFSSRRKQTTIQYLIITEKSQFVNSYYQKSCLILLYLTLNTFL